MRKKNTPLVIPENCCLACRFSATVDKSDLTCFAQPPIRIEENGSYRYIRGVPISPTDPPCTFFKPKEHA